MWLEEKPENAASIPGSVDIALASMGVYIFFFQAEDGIRDVAVTGVQTCALPIFVIVCKLSRAMPNIRLPDGSSKSFPNPVTVAEIAQEIGRASCRERV